MGQELHTFTLFGSLIEPKILQPWLSGGPSHRFPPHMDGEISQGRKDAFRRVFQDRALLDEVEDAFAEFSTGTVDLQDMM